MFLHNKMELECEFCNKSFSNISNLRYHKKTNKKCQIIQKQKVEHEIETFNCSFCNKTFTKQTIKIHNKTCKKKLNEEIKTLQIENNEFKSALSEKDEQIKKILSEKDEQIKKILSEKDEQIEKMCEKDEEIKNLKLRIMELEIENRIYLQDREIVQKLAMQPKTSTSTNNKIKVNNFFDDPERIKQIIDEKLNKDYVSDGQKGVALFAVNTMLQDDNKNKNYICSDTSRHIFKFQNSDGNIEKDVKAMKLTNMLIDAGISSKSYTVAQSLWTDKDGKIDVNKFETYSPYIYQIATMQLDNSIFRNELACLTSS